MENFYISDILIIGVSAALLVFIVIGAWRIVTAIRISKKEMVKKRKEFVKKQRDTNDAIEAALKIRNQREDQAREKSSYTRLCASTDHKFVVQFEKKYAAQWTAKDHKNLKWIFEQLTQRPEARSIALSSVEAQNRRQLDQVAQLQELLNKKGWAFSSEQIYTIVEFELNEERIEAAKKKILRNNATERDEIFRAYLTISNSSDDLMMQGLERALSARNQPPVPATVLKSEIEQLEKTLELQKFEQGLLSEHTGLGLPRVDEMSGSDFEEFVATLFGKMGYHVERTKLTGDQGADVIVTKFGERIAIQVKRSAGRVGNRAVQEVLGAVSYYKGKRGMVVTNSFFTQAAVELANANQVEMINRDRLQELIRMYW